MRKVWVYQEQQVAIPDFVQSGNYDLMTLNQFVDSSPDHNAFYIIACPPTGLRVAAQKVRESGLQYVVWATPEAFVKTLEQDIASGALSNFGYVSLPTTETLLITAMSYTFANVPPETKSGTPQPPSPPIPTPVPPPPPPAAPMPAPPVSVTSVPPSPPPEVQRRRGSKAQTAIPLELPPAPEFEALRARPGLPPTISGNLVGHPGVYTVSVYASTTNERPSEPSFSFLVAIPDGSNTGTFQFSPPGEPGTTVYLWLGVSGYHPDPVPLTAPVVVPRQPAVGKVRVGKVTTSTGNTVLADTPFAVLLNVNVSGPSTLVAGYLNLGGATLHASEVIQGRGQLTWSVPGLPPGDYRIAVSVYTPISKTRSGRVRVVSMLAGKAVVRSTVYGSIAVTGSDARVATTAIVAEAKAGKMPVGVVQQYDWEDPKLPPPISPTEGLLVVMTPPNVPPNPPPTIATVLTATTQPPNLPELNAVASWGGGAVPLYVTTLTGKPWGVEKGIATAVLPFDPTLEKQRTLILAQILRRAAK